MSLFKFENGDIIKNTIITNPKNKFLFYSGSVIYNDSVQENGYDWDGPEGNPSYLTKFIPSGYISLYEMNIDRPTGSGDSDMIRPFIYDESDGLVFGSYPISSSIYPRYFSSSEPPDENRKYLDSLMNTINYYNYMSLEFDTEKLYENDFNVISIPSVFYGNKIKPGSVRLELIVTGSQDDIVINDSRRRNGELVDSSGVVHGVVLYNEGFVILKKGLDLLTEKHKSGTDGPIGSYWSDFGIDTELSTNFAWSIEFEGINEVPVLTMFAHARKNELNHSNNPSWLKDRLPSTSSSPQNYVEANNRKIRNITKTELIEGDPSFKKETYISKIAIYDKHKKVIGYARLARPIRKTEEREFTFKLKLDL